MVFKCTKKFSKSEFEEICYYKKKVYSLRITLYVYILYIHKILSSYTCIWFKGWLLN